MKYYLYFILFIFFHSANAQHLNLIGYHYPYQSTFENAYQNYPNIPKGILEAVAWSNSRMVHLTSGEEESCMEMPRAYGLMGLTLNGKNYFKENLRLISFLSGIRIKDIIQSPNSHCFAYAKAYSKLIDSFRSQKKYAELPGTLNLELHGKILRTLSEIPDTGLVNQYAQDAQLFQIFTFLSSTEKSNTYHFSPYTFDLNSYFGNNLPLLQASKIIIESNGISTEEGITYQSSEQLDRSADYGPALWNPAASCNYSSRNGVAVSAITIHTVQGTYAGCISWFQNCNASVSAHYVIRSSDGQVTQMVLESSKAWHVGSENPYTIGYEHEGYVSNASWYTTAMYNSSAALTRDVCNSGYGINPLRCYFGASSSGTNTLGNCIRIKGHQHYQNQSHTDPGINWNWELYYRLINNSPNQTTITATSGTFYDSGGSGGNYNNDERYFTLFSIPGATTITLNFSSFNLENNWDYLYIYNGATNTSPLIGVYTGTNSPGSVTSTGSNLLVEFRSDCSTTASGWVANFTSNAIPPPVGDQIPPTTLVQNPGNWVTQNFTANFTDADNSGGSGLEKSYYQVIDYDGLDWRANADKGFFSDNFDLPNIHSEWTNVSGNWQINNGYLVQDDQNNSNSNIYAYINHGLSNRYLYHWAGKMEGSGTNRRAGFHYFCDDPTLSNRNNSYFIWFRLDTDKVQLYKVVNDVFTMVDEVSFNFNVAQWYDFKVIYDRITGKHLIYIDNSLIQSWTDTSPYSGGDYISFRNGNCIYTVNNLKIYRSRNSSALVEVGINGDLRFQNTNPLTFAGRIKSIVSDSNANLSAIHFQDVNVDWTPPSEPLLVNDGIGSDIDTFYNNTEIYANWSLSYDMHSDISRYLYAIGTSPGATDVVNWTDHFWNDTLHVTGLNLNYGTVYYVSVRSENGAGLLSAITSSNGQRLLTPTQAPVAQFNTSGTIICVNDSIQFQNSSSNAVTYQWLFPGGNPSSSALANPSVLFSNSGTYLITLVANGPGGTDTIQSSINITIHLPVNAQFTASDTIVYLPNAFVGFNNLSQNANGYHWEFGDGNNSTGNSPWHLYTQQGVYLVTLTAVNDACPLSLAYQTITVNGINAIPEEEKEVLFYVFQQDQNLILNFDCTQSDEYTFALIDNNGKLIEKKNQKSMIGNNRITIPIATLAEGIYFIQLTRASGLHSVKTISIIK